MNPYPGQSNDFAENGRSGQHPLPLPFAGATHPSGGKISSPVATVSRPPTLYCTSTESFFP
jgi:hypothetical protein